MKKKNKKKKTVRAKGQRWMWFRPQLTARLENLPSGPGLQGPLGHAPSRPLENRESRTNRKRGVNEAVEILTSQVDWPKKVAELFYLPLK